MTARLAQKGKPQLKWIQSLENIPRHLIVSHVSVQIQKLRHPLDAQVIFLQRRTLRSIIIDEKLLSDSRNDPECRGTFHESQPEESVSGRAEKVFAEKEQDVDQVHYAPFSAWLKKRDRNAVLKVFLQRRQKELGRQN